MYRFFILLLIFSFLNSNSFAEKSKDTIVDTGQDKCYNNSGEFSCPGQREDFYGQDSQYAGESSLYKNNSDGTVTDLNTGLIWSKSVDTAKFSLAEAEDIAGKMWLGGYSDWRVPNIKELYSLIDFRGNTGFSGPGMSSIPRNSVPFINTDYFDFKYGQIEVGERYIDGQWLSSTKYVSTTMEGDKTLFGVNFVDGRIKGYGYIRPNSSKEKKFYVRYVRGPAYGDNDFLDNQDGTITDQATGLVWMQADSGKAMNWKQALSYAENLEYAGYDDWRLPNAKELQYIVDYSRSPDTTFSAAIDPIFTTTVIVNETGQSDYPYFWTSTTHLDGPSPGSRAAYVAFGRALGKMNGKVMDVHGAGAQRSDPKIGNPEYQGPQGDLIRINNYVRCVRGGDVTLQKDQPSSGNRHKYPYNIKIISTQPSGKKRRPSPQDSHRRLPPYSR